jgi:predicted peroxiredoxin
MTRRKLIFFAGKDPADDASRVWTAYHFALVAHRAGLETEVRLAGDAVKALRVDGLPDGPQGAQVRTNMAEAVRLGLFVSG